jgi:predicted dinucleotide-binding enzyme
LALRFAAAGEALIIGSRSPEKAGQAAAKIRERVGGATVSGAENAAALSEAERVLLAFPAAWFRSSTRRRVPSPGSSSST